MLSVTPLRGRIAADVSGPVFKQPNRNRLSGRFFAIRRERVSGMINIWGEGIAPGRTYAGGRASGCGQHFFAHDVMPRFRILEHTADVGFEAFGATLAEVYENAARALAHLIAEPKSIKSSEAVRIEVQGADGPDLLVNWLSEILYRHDAERWLFREFTIESLDDHTVSGIAWGEKFDQARHQTNLMVKAITYHQLSLQQTADGWRAQVYVDI